MAPFYTHDRRKLKRTQPKPVAAANTRAKQPSSLSPTTPSISIQRALADPSQLTPEHILYLQRTVGNATVARMLSGARPNNAAPSGVVQTKRMEVGAANDPHEREAERLAQQTLSPAKQHNSTGGSSLTATAPVQRAPADEALAQVGEKGGAINDTLAREFHAATLGGQSVPDHVRAPVEELTGANLSHVKVHKNAKAHAVNRKLAAKASTHQHHILLGKGQSEHDSHLMAHELAHTVQQGAAPQSAGGFIQRNDDDSDSGPHPDASAVATFIQELDFALNLSTGSGRRGVERVTEIDVTPPQVSDANVERILEAIMVAVRNAAQQALENPQALITAKSAEYLEAENRATDLNAREMKYLGKARRQLDKARKAKTWFGKRYHVSRTQHYRGKANKVNSGPATEAFTKIDHVYFKQKSAPIHALLAPLGQQLKALYKMVGRPAELGLRDGTDPSETLFLLIQDYAEQAERAPA